MDNAIVKDEFYDALSRYVSEYWRDEVTVVDFNEYIAYGGGCGTCSYEEIAIDFDCVDEDGNKLKYTIWEDFGTILNKILNYS